MTEYSAPAAGCAVDILRELSKRRRPLSLADLAAVVPRSKSLIFRVLRELMKSDMVVRDSTGGYGLGFSAFEIGTAFVSQMDPSRHARHLLRDLAQRCEGSVSLSVLRDRDAVFVVRYQGPQDATVQSRLGDRIPATCLASGKAMLAQLSGDTVRQMYQDPLPRLTTRSVRHVADLCEQLELVKTRGFAVSKEETIEGRCAVAVPLAASSRHMGVCALGISIDRSRFRSPQQRSKLIDQLLVAKDILKGDLVDLSVSA